MVINSIASNPTLQEEVFTEARDVFLGSMPLPFGALVLADDEEDHEGEIRRPRSKYEAVARVLASGAFLSLLSFSRELISDKPGTALDLSPERADYVLRRRVPSFVEPVIDTSSGHAPSTSLSHSLTIGRVSLPYRPSRASRTLSRPYAHTNPSLIVLEKLAVCLRLSEPVLMVGETGTGKTAAVGHLAEKMGKRLCALNLSNQTEAGDLVGGFRPIDEVEEARRELVAVERGHIEANFVPTNQEPHRSS